MIRSITARLMTLHCCLGYALHNETFCDVLKVISIPLPVQMCIPMGLLIIVLCLRICQIPVLSAEKSWAARQAIPLRQDIAWQASLRFMTESIYWLRQAQPQMPREFRTFRMRRPFIIDLGKQWRKKSKFKIGQPFCGAVLFVAMGCRNDFSIDAAVTSPF